MSLTFLSRPVLIHLEAYGGVIQLSEIKKISSFVFRRWTKLLQGWNNMRVS